MLTTLALAVALQGSAAKIPADLVGEWRYTSVRGTTYWDTSSGAYLGHGGGNSGLYVFAKDGTFKEYVYMENSPTVGWTTKIYTTTEGKVEVEGDTVKLTVLKGHYKTQDNRVPRYNIDRDMTPEEAKKMARTCRFALSSEGGKTSLVFDLGKSKTRYERAR